MAVTDLWVRADGTPTARHGRGKRWRTTVPGHPSKAFTSKQAARAWEVELLRRPPVPVEARTTVGELLPSYLATKRALSAGGLGSVRAGAGQVMTRWAATPVCDIKPYLIEAWLAEMQVQTGPRHDRWLVPASHASRVKALQVLRGVLGIAVQREMIPANPCVGVSTGRPPRPEPRFLAVGDLTVLAWSCDGWSASGPLWAYWAPLVMLLGTSGLRVGEAVSLTVGDVDVARRRVRVRASRAKSGRGRDVPVVGPVLAMLSLRGRPSSARLFVTPAGRPVDVGHWRARVWRPTVEAVLPGSGLTIHDLRHTAASLMIASGATVKDVQSALGHASAKMTLDTYAGLFDAGLDDVAARVERMLL